MMVPTEPIPDLIVRQSGFALAALDAVLNSMMRIRRSPEVRQFRLDAGVREVVVVLEAAVGLPLACNKQYLFRVGPA